MVTITSPTARDSTKQALDPDRQGFPEPTLLPHLAQAIPLQSASWLLTVTDVTTGQSAISPPWPRLLDACCATIAARLDSATERQVVDALRSETTALYSHLSPALLDLATSHLIPAGDSWDREQRAERICRLAVRYPNNAGGLLVDLASAALCDLDADRKLTAGAWFLPLTVGAERRAIIDAWCADPRWFDVGPLVAVLTASDESEREPLTAMLLRSLDYPGLAVSTLASAWPVLARSKRHEAGLRLSEAWVAIRNEQPAWWLALVWSRIRAMDIPGLSLGVSENSRMDPLDANWRDQLAAFQTLASHHEWSDVLRAQLGANQWMAGRHYPDLTENQAAQLLEQVIGYWGGSAQAAGPGEEEAADPTALPPTQPVSPDEPPRSPVDATPSGGLVGRVGDWLGGVFGGRSRGGQASEQPATRGGPVAVDTTVSEPARVVRRELQADVSINDDSGVERQLTSAFIAGRSHQLALSIGRGASIRVGTAFNEPRVSPDTTAEQLDLRLIYNDEIASGSVELPNDPVRDSGVWRTTLTVPADATEIKATVVVLHKGRVLQTAEIAGQVELNLTAAITADTQISFSVVDQVHQLENLGEREAFDASVISDGASSTAFAGANIGVRALDGVDDTIRMLTERLFKKTEAVAMSGAATDLAQFEELLRFLATHGKLLHSVLIKQLMPALDDANRIQIVSTNPSAILPLEFVYSGPSPTHTATLCDSWQQALNTGQCPSCQQQATDQRSPTMCPLNFWALSKIIERHASVKPDPNTQDFVVRTGDPSGRRDLRPIQQAVFAASDNVPEELVESTLTLLSDAVAHCEDALTWKDWEDSVTAKSPALLVGMPHNALDPALKISTLEIGRGSQLRAGEVTRKMICGDASQPGPVVLLLGCQTAHGGPQPFHTFVGEFRNNGAAVVIGTLATVLGEHAAPVVQAIVRELAEPKFNHTTFGELLLRIRRQMVSQGILIALAIAAFGDADWGLGPSSESVPDPGPELGPDSPPVSGLGN